MYSPVGCLFVGHLTSMAVPYVMVSRRAHSLAVGSAVPWRGLYSFSQDAPVGKVEHGT